MSWLGTEDDRSTQLLAHLETDHSVVPSALCAAAEQHELRGDTATLPCHNLVSLRSQSYSHSGQRLLRSIASWW